MILDLVAVNEGRATGPPSHPHLDVAAPRLKVWLGADLGPE